jgi:hypothetical protein
MSIYGAILNTKTKVDTFCVGLAYSMAGVIFQAGRKRTMMDYAKLMYHQAYDGTEKASKGLDAINEAITTMISSRSWKDDKLVREMMNKETFIGSKDALESGLCDEVIESDQLNRPRITSDAKASWKFAEEYVNKFLPVIAKNQIQNITSMKKVAQALNLVSEASEDSMVEAVQKITAKAKKAEEQDDEIDKLKKAVKKAEDDKKNAEDALATAKKKMEEDEEASKKAKADEDKKKADDDKKAKAKAKIVALNKDRNLNLSDALITGYCNLAGTSEEALAEVVKTIEAIPVVKRAAIPFKNKSVQTAKNIASNAAAAAGNAANEDDVDFPLIENGEEDSTSPTGHKAGDTKGFVDAFNSFDANKFKNRKR